MGPPSSSSSSFTTVVRSNLFEPCHTVTSKVPGLLERCSSSAHWFKREVGATMRVAEGTGVTFAFTRGLNAWFSRSWRALVACWPSASFADTSSHVVLVCIRADIMIVFPIPTWNNIKNCAETLIWFNSLSILKYTVKKGWELYVAAKSETYHH